MNMTRRRNATFRTRSTNPRRSGALSRAAAAVLEQLEPRQLFSGSPAATIAGPATVAEGATYPLALSTANLTTPVDHWTVTWGDGQQSTVAGTASEADHVYADGPAAVTITATASLPNGSVLTANLTGAGITSLGQLDPAFGTAGGVTTTAFTAAEALAPLDDGQFVQAASVGSGGLTNVLQRFNADGTLDTTFGTAGTLTVPKATNIVSVLDEHVADPYHPGYQVERLLVVGNVDTDHLSVCHPYLWRYDLGESAMGLPDGTPDAAFGTNGVVALPTLLGTGSSEGDNAFAATISPAGQIVVAGAAWRGYNGYGANGEFLTVSRFNPDGSPDTTFNGTGQRAIDVGAASLPSADTNGAQPVALVAAADGSAVVLAASGQVAKVTNAGQLDPAFGTAGLTYLKQSATNGVVGYSASFSALTLDAAGNLMAGGTLQLGTTYGWAVGRFSYATGAIDPTYAATDAANQHYLPGVDGRVTSGTASDGFVALTTTSDGKLVGLRQQEAFTGATSWTLSAGRFAADGSPDTSFAPGGFTTVTYAGSTNSNAVLAIQSDGKLLAASTTVAPTTPYATHYGIVRLGQTVPGTVTAVAASVANVAPTAAITNAPAGHVPEGTPLSLTATAADASPTDAAAGLPLAWAVTRDGQTFATGTGSTFTFTPDDNGTYAVTVTTTDKDGGVGSASATVTADNVAPTPTIGGPITSTTEGAAVSLGGSATDPSAADTAAGLALAWSATKNGVAYTTGTGGAFAFTPDDNGTYVVTLKATDKDGGVGTTTDTVTVANVAPTPTIAAPVTAANEGTAIRLAGSATDPSPADTAAGLALGWSVTKNGAAFATGSGPAYAFTPDDNGAYVVTLTATDKDGASSSTTDAVAVANVAPTAALAAATGPRVEGTAVTLAGSATDPSTADTAAGLSLAWSVTKNGSPFATGTGGAVAFTPNDNGTYAVTLTATDKDGGVGTATSTVSVANVAPTAAFAAPVTTATEGAAVSLTGVATDPGAADVAAGLPLTWTVTKNGSAYANGTGAAVAFTPDDNGTYVATLRTTDKDGGVGTASDTVTVTNVAPTVVLANAITASNEGTAITLAGSATDPSPADTAAGLTLAWAVTKNGSAFANGTGSAPAFTPDDNGTYVATLTATDKDGGVGTATDTIAVANVAPVAAFASPVTAGAEGTPIALTGTATDAGPADVAAGLTLAWAVAKNGSPFATGTGGAVAFTPNDNGTYVVTLTATDKDGGVGTTTDTVAVANVAPVATLTGPATANEGAAVTFAGSATDAGSADTAAGLSLTYAVTKNGTVFAFANGPGITFTPDDNGAYAVTVTATDKDGGTATATRPLAVANVAPTAAIPSPVTTAAEGTAVTLAGTAADLSTVDAAAGLAPAWSVTKNGSPFATGSGLTLAFTPDDNGTYVATLTATDKDGGIGTATDTVNVTNVAPKPTIAAPVTTGYVGVAVALTGSATDPSAADTTAGVSLAWSVTKGGAAFGTAGTGSSYAFTPTATGTYVVTLTATDKDGGASSTTDTVAVGPAGYRLAGTTLMYNGTAEATNVTSFALRADGNAYYLTAAKAFGVNAYATGTNTGLGTVYSYGMRSDGYAYYWAQADSRLYLNLTSQNIPVDNTPIQGFGLRSDGYGYFWETGTRTLFLNTPGFTVPVDNNPVAGFGMRSDGSAYFWDATTKLLQVNTPGANYQIGSGTVQGFGMRSDGSAFFWDVATNNLYVNVLTSAPAGTSIQLYGTAVSAFTTDSDGNGYYVPVNTTSLRRDTVTTDSLITPAYVAGTLRNAGVGPVSAVTYGVLANGATTSVTIPL